MSWLLESASGDASFVSIQSRLSVLEENCLEPKGISLPALRFDEFARNLERPAVGTGITRHSAVASHAFGIAVLTRHACWHGYRQYHIFKETAHESTVNSETYFGKSFSEALLRVGLAFILKIRTGF